LDTEASSYTKPSSVISKTVSSSETISSVNENGASANNLHQNLFALMSVFFGVFFL